MLVIVVVVVVVVVVAAVVVVIVVVVGVVVVVVAAAVVVVGFFLCVCACVRASMGRNVKSTKPNNTWGWGWGDWGGGGGAGGRNILPSTGHENNIAQTKPDKCPSSTSHSSPFNCCLSVVL